MATLALVLVWENKEIALVASNPCSGEPLKVLATVQGKSSVKSSMLEEAPGGPVAQELHCGDNDWQSSHYINASSDNLEISITADSTINTTDLLKHVLAFR